MLIYGTPDILNGPAGPLAGVGGTLGAVSSDAWTNFVRDLYTMPPEGVPGSIVDRAQQLNWYASIVQAYPGSDWSDVARAFNWSSGDLAAYVRKAYQSVYDQIIAINASPISDEAKQAFTAHVLARRFVVPDLFAQVFGVTFDGPLTEPRYLPDPILGNTRRVSTVDATATSDGYVYHLLYGWIGVLPAGSSPAVQGFADPSAYGQPPTFQLDFGTGGFLPVVVGERSRIPFDRDTLEMLAEVRQRIARADDGTFDWFENRDTATRRLAQLAARWGLSESEAVQAAFNNPGVTVEMARAQGIDLRRYLPNLQLTQQAVTVQTVEPASTYVPAEDEYQVSVTSEAMRYALAQGMTLQVYYGNIRSAVERLAYDVPRVSAEMDAYTVTFDDVSMALVGMGRENWLSRLALFRSDPAAYQALVDAEAAAAAAAAAALAAAQAVAIASGPDGAADVATVTALEVTQTAAQVASDAAQAASNAATVQEASDAAEVAQTAADTATQTADAVTTTTTTTTTTATTTGAPAMLQLPANLGTMTEAQKIAWYRATLAAGNSDAAIRAAVESRYGRQSDSDWTYLRARAAQAAPAAGGAGLLIAAAAAYFLLG